MEAEENIDELSLEFSGEHCYSKLPSTLDNIKGHAERVTYEEGSSVTPVLTPLDRTHDNFEALLLLLLRAYTKNHASITLSSQAGNIPGEVGISGEALDTLSSEQISALITSNSVNYEVIQHILAQQKMRPGARRGMSPPTILNGSLSSQLSPMDAPSASISSVIEETQREACVGPSSPLGQVIPTRTSNAALGNLPSTNQHLQKMIQITPEQLNLLQTQVHGLLQAQNIPLPSHLSSELIQMLLLRQLHLQHGAGVTSTSPKESTMPVSSVTVTSAAVDSGGLSVGETLGVTVEGGNGKSDSSERGGGGDGDGGGGNIAMEEGKTPVQAKEPSVSTKPVPLPSVSTQPVPLPSVSTQPVPLPSVSTQPVPLRSVSNKPVSLPNVSTKPVPLPSVSTKPVPPPSVSTQPVPLPSVSTKPVPLPSVSTKSAPLTRAAISGFQASTSVATTRRGGGTRGAARGGTRGVGRGRRRASGVSTGQRKRAVPLTSDPSTTSGKMEPNSPPTPYDLFYNEVLSTVQSSNPLIDSVKVISMMWAAMGQDVKKRYYDEHERLKALHLLEKEQEEEKIEHITIKSLIAGAPHMTQEADEKTTVCAAVSISDVEMPPEPEIIEKIDLESIIPLKDDKLCVSYDCANLAVFSVNRGPRYCSNECVVNHCRRTFEIFVSRRIIHC